MKALFFILGLSLVGTLVFAASAKDEAASPASSASSASAASAASTTSAASAASTTGTTTVAKQNAKASGPKEDAKKIKRVQDMTAQELTDGITKTLDRSDEVLDYIPGFKKAKDPDGKGYYTYNGVRLEKLDKAKLASLYGRIRQERTRLNTERINRQLETIRQAARVPQPPSPPPQLPPPLPPKAPPAPPQPPRR